MPTTRTLTRTSEHAGGSLPGFVMLVVHLLWILGAFWLFASSIGRPGLPESGSSPVGVVLGFLGLAFGLVAVNGYFTLQPNEARVQILFGSYKGTVRRSGFHWANPFYTAGLFTPRGRATSAGATRISLRVHNFNSETLKVNDKRGNPVEIAAVVAWRVADTAQAAFDVEDYKRYVQVQSEAAIRGIASSFAYDHGEHDEPTLRSGAEEVAEALQAELQARLAKAGVVVEEARLTHLAYAPEIASVMLRRQQAEAIVAARAQIVQGAVGMVRTALAELESQQIVQLDPERRAAMVSNLLVVLCGNADASPVINTGTLYG